MEKHQKITYTLTESELKEAIRNYFMAKLDGEYNFSVNDIEITADIDQGGFDVKNHKAKLTVNKKESIRL